MDRIDENRNELAESSAWQNFMEAMLTFSSNRLKDEPYSELIANGLDVFLKFPGSRTAYLFMLDQESFEFHFSLSSSSAEQADAEKFFNLILNDGGIATALETGKVVFWTLDSESESNRYFLIIPLVASAEVIGLVLVQLSEASKKLEQLLLGLCSLHAIQYAHILFSARLKRNLNNLKGILEQRISQKTQDIKQQKRELQLIIDSIQTGVVLIDKETNKIADVNQVALQILGTSRTQLIGKNISEFFFDAIQNDSSKITHEFRLSKDECILKKEDGSLVPIVKAVTEVTLGGNQYFLESFFDISERKNAELEIQKSESRFRTIFEKAGIGMVITNLEGGIVNTNSAFQRMLGYSAEEARELYFSDIIDQGMRKKRKPILIAPATKSTADSSPKEMKLINKDGELIWGRLIETFVRDAKNAPLFGLFMIEDISEQKKNEEALYRQSNLLVGAADATNALLTQAEFDSAIKNALMSLGKAAEVDRVYIFKNHKEASTGEPLTSLQYLWQKKFGFTSDKDPQLQNISYKREFPRWYEALSGGESITGLVKDFPEKERNLLEAQESKSTLIVPILIGSEFWGFIGFDDCLRERTWFEAEESILKATATSLGGAIQRERQKQDLLESKERAEEANRLKSSLLANMSHEIRTPINGILGFAELLHEIIQDSDQKEMSSKILNSTKRLMSTLNSILNLSELEAGKLENRIAPYNLSSLVVNSASYFESIVRQKNLYLRYNIKDEDIEGLVDEVLFAQVINNLVDNAVKYTKEGGINVEIGSVEENGKLFGVVQVRDTGIGIAKEKQDLIFQEFRQVSEGLNRLYEGSGLGLTLAKKMVELMKGRIDVHSELGKGSSFKIIIPAEKKQKPKKAKQVSPPQTLKPERRKNEALPEVLLVEDNIINKEVTVRYLRDVCIVDHAADGLTAIKKAASKKYEVIIMDINLGEGMNGIEAAQEIKKIEGYENTPIIAATGYAMPGDKEKLLSAGLTHYIPKPFDKKSIVSLIKEVI